MRLSNGNTIDRRVKDSCGEEGYVFWIPNSFDPPVYLARGESFDDAYAWFLCDPRVESELEVDANYLADWIDDWNEDRPATWDDLMEAFQNGKTWVTINDNGTVIDPEAAMGTTLASWRRKYDS